MSRRDSDLESSVPVNREQAHHLAHTLKSLLGSIGAGSMSLHAEQIEKSVSQGDQDGAEVFIAELAPPFNAVISDLSACKAAMEEGLDTQANA